MFNLIYHLTALVPYALCALCIAVYVCPPAHNWLFSRLPATNKTAASVAIYAIGCALFGEVCGSFWAVLLPVALYFYMNRADWHSAVNKAKSVGSNLQDRF